MKSLFFIGLVVPEPLSNEIQEIKTTFAARHFTSHGLHTLPHITLEAPFRVTAEELDLIKTGVKRIAYETRPFEIAIQGYGHFRKQVIYLHIVQNQLLLDIAQNISRLRHGNQSSTLNDFKPHITIAHKDLNALEFDRAWEELKHKEFRASFKSESISVLEHRNGRWEIHSTFSFKESGAV